MAISTINKGYTKDNGKSEGIVCPECKKAVNLHLFSTTDTSVVAMLKNKKGDSNIAVCPNCAAIFSVADNYMKEKTAGTTVFITESDLEVIIKGQ